MELCVWGLLFSVWLKVRGLGEVSEEGMKREKSLPLYMLRGHRYVKSFNFMLSIISRYPSMRERLISKLDVTYDKCRSVGIGCELKSR